MWLRVLHDLLSTKGMPYLLTNTMLRNDLRESLILLSHKLHFVKKYVIILYKLKH
jgi:hypothetical protein